MGRINLQESEYPLSVVQIDHTLMDIILVEEISRKPIGRPWVTLAIDVYSRIVTGLYVSFEPPGALGTGMCVANSILPKEAWLTRLDIDGEWPCSGKMKMIHLDNSKEFSNDLLSPLCEEYGIKLELKPIKNTHWGVHIERLLETFLDEINTLLGITFSNPKQRGGFNTEGKAIFTLMDFEKWLITYVVNVYNKRIHSAIGMTPFHKFEEGIYQKTGISPRVFNEIKVKLDFLPYVERTIQEYGVVIDHIHYFGAVLKKWVHANEKLTVKNRQKRKFIFKRDPSDISVVYFFDPDLNEYFQIPYRDTSRPPMTLWKYKEILSQLENSEEKQVDEDLIFQAYEKSLNREINKTLPDKLQNKNFFETIKPKIDFTNLKPFDDIEYDYLIESIRSIAAQNNRERIKIINSNKWIKYQAAEKILNHLEELLIYPKISTMPNMLIVGDTNNGKTILVNRFYNSHKPEIIGEDERLSIPVVYMQAPPLPDEKRFYHQLLDSLNAPYSHSDKLKRLEKQAINVLNHVGTKILIIDKIHNILAGNTSKQSAFLNVVKDMANELQIVIVAVGIKESINIMNTDSQIANRFIPEFLPKWYYNEEYIRLLASFERLLPLQKPSNLTSKDLSQKILDLSEGTIGEITSLLNLASIEAIKSGQEKIDLNILNKVNFVRPSERRKLDKKLISL